MRFAEVVAFYLFNKQESCRIDASNLTLLNNWSASNADCAPPLSTAAETCARRLQRFYQKRSKQDHKSSEFWERYLNKSVMSPAQPDGEEGDACANHSQTLYDQQPPVAIFVLGPSASGKTYSTRIHLKTVLEANALNANRCFVSIDGGIMREDGVSDVWDEVLKISRLIQASQDTSTSDDVSHFFQSCQEPNPFKENERFVGFVDAYKLFGKPASDGAKEIIYKDMMEKKANLVWPETAAGCISATNLLPSFVSSRFGICKMWDYQRKLTKAGYQIIYIAINTDKQICQKRGESRAVGEGKIYDPTTWEYAVSAVSNVLSTWHGRRRRAPIFWRKEEKNTTGVSFIINNNPNNMGGGDDMNVTTGDVKVAIKEGVATFQNTLI